MRKQSGTVWILLKVLRVLWAHPAARLVPATHRTSLVPGLYGLQLTLRVWGVKALPSDKYGLSPSRYIYMIDRTS